MAVVLTLVETKQIIYINETVQKTVQTIQNTAIIIIIIIII